MRFIDKKGRSIYLEENYNTIYAYFIEGDKRTNIGSIQFIVVENSNKYQDYESIAYPEQMHIDEGYRRCGIATEIIKYAKEIYGKVYFYQDNGCGGNTDEIHYSSQGLGFKNFCENNGITKIFSEYEEDDYEY